MAASTDGSQARISHVDLLRDSARLDWLEQHDGRYYNVDRISAKVGQGFSHGWYSYQNIRAAIDAAIAAMTKREGSNV